MSVDYAITVHSIAAQSIQLFLLHTFCRLASFKFICLAKEKRHKVALTKRIPIVANELESTLMAAIMANTRRQIGNGPVFEQTHTGGQLFDQSQRRLQVVSSPVNYTEKGCQ